MYLSLCNFSLVYYSIGDEGESYRLRVFGYRGNASDSFSAHNGYRFSTYDIDNDEAPECCPCAPAYGGGWWFYGYVAAIFYFLTETITT